MPNLSRRGLSVISSVAVAACAWLACGGSDDSPVEPRDAESPQTVDDLVAVPQGSTSVRLLWTAPGDDADVGQATQYDIRLSRERLEGIEWNRATPVTAPPEPRIAGTGESFVLADLEGIEPWFFALRTADEIPNWSDWSNVAEASLDGVPPSAISDLVASAPEDSAVTLTWTAVGDDRDFGRAQVYDIRFATEPAAPWSEMRFLLDEPVPLPSGEQESFRVGSLNPGAIYYFRMVVGDDIPNWSGESNEVSINPSTAPAPVQDLEVASQSDSSLALTWTATGDDEHRGTATAYEIRFGFAGTPWEELSPVATPPVPRPADSAEEYELTGLAPDTTYVVQVRAADDLGLWSAPSNPATGRTLDLLNPSPITDLVATTLTAQAIELSWTAPGDNGTSGRASDYDLRHALSAQGIAAWSEATRVTVPTPSDPGSTDSAIVTGLAPNTRYYFGIRTGDEVPNWSSTSNVANAPTLADGACCIDDYACVMLTRDDCESEFGGFQGAGTSCNPNPCIPEPSELVEQGWLLFEENSFIDALARFDLAIVRDAGFAPAYLGQGWVRLTLGDSSDRFADALSSFDSAIARGLDNADVRAGRASANLGVDDHLNEAIADAETALQMKPQYVFAHRTSFDSRDLHLIGAFAEAALGRFQAALAAAEAIEGSGILQDEPTTWNVSGVSYPSYEAAVLAFLHRSSEIYAG